MIGRAIIEDVMRHYKIQPSVFFGNRRGVHRVTKARRIAIGRLKDAGFNSAAIARLMKRNYSTIQYWLHPEYRERRTHYCRQLRASHKEAGASV